jgi:large subunit ribosomal protein L4
MKLTVKDKNGNDQGELTLTFTAVEEGKGNQAVHDVVVAYQAAQRSGTACTKTMGEVNGSGKKPWRQKGTGRARAGSFASPLWVGGGVTFGPKPRDFTKKVTKKTRSLALRKAFGERVKAGDVLVIDEIKFDAPKTKNMLGLLSALKLAGTTLVIADGADKNITLSSRNIKKLDLTSSSSLNTYQVLRYDKLVFTRGAIESLDQRLKKD